MAKRILWGLPLGAVFLFLILQPLPWILALLAVGHIIAQYEFYAIIPGLSGRGKWGHIIVSTLVWLGCSLALAGIGPPLLLAVYIGFTLIGYAIVLVLRYELGKDSRAHIRLLRTYMFITLPFAFIPALFTWPGGMPVALLLIGASWGADTGAIFAGKLAGKTPLSPRLSPKKTREGALGGMLSAALIWVGCGLIYPPGLLAPLAVAVPQWGYLLILALLGAALAGVGIFGDLAFSLFKRLADAKDYGRFIPGHGGLLDRFDSMLFAAPPLYLLCLLLSL
jgi:phosphatidate cytidylyltransferase